jgi:uncharacterized protein (DUF2126 family)/transglutaminase-like putative cysteine protease
MAIRVALNHKTRHRYAQPVWLSPQVVRLRPAPHCRTPILSYSLTVTPAEHFENWQQDPYANFQARLVFPNKTREFAVEVDLVADLTVINPFDFFVEQHAEHYPFDYGELLKRELAPYLEVAPLGPKLEAFVAEVRKEHVPTVDYLVELNQALSKRVAYVIRMEPGIQAPEHTLTCLSGSCRDTAWLLVQVLRHLGLATRFVSGYLIQLAHDIKPLEGPVGVAKDFTDLHAWVEVYLPGAGWIGLDPTSGLMAGEGHIPLAATAEPSSAAAITGFFSLDDEAVVQVDPEVGDQPAPAAGQDEFHFEMSVTRFHEDPRVTKPYTDDQWAEIDALGHRVDADLAAGDVRLTMGGEPTFVAIEGTDEPEWVAQAMGPRKYGMGDQLVRRLRDRFAPGGFLHHGQGKWYPGESLPRWALGLYWRQDGEPIWADPALVADESAPGNAATEADAQRFAVRLAEHLGVTAEHVVPGYEDVWWYMWKEQRLPVNVDPFDSKLANEETRKRLARVFEQGLTKVIGYCLPLKRAHGYDGVDSWVTGPWFLRPERMYLVPGDSPMGYRLPLESIPWVAPTDYPHLHERDPMERRGPLSARVAGVQQPPIRGAPEPTNPRGFVDQVLEPEEALVAVGATETVARSAGDGAGDGSGNGAGAGGLGHGPLPTAATRAARAVHLGGVGRQVDLGPGHGRPPARGESAVGTVRTALCTEVRGGVLRVFMPPQRYIEDYLDLVAAIEATAADLRQPVLVEGYTPPFDPRVNEMRVTPDPGVIEVNTHPVRTWDELVRNADALHEEARHCRLCAEKFMVDGRHVGSCGGNHIVFGGATPADSPVLRRPDLLRSLLGFWHNHPALSFLFSGMFVGPTSQAPRVDEARNDQVYELELAFKQVPGPDKLNIPPWLVDRIFRNLLVDSTGNTHRTEFCIDKLYAPETATGRLGLVEMRGFEMPPHPRMSLTQRLLLRALIAHFWHKPYERPLVRWQTEIHDRFMLPHFVAQDLDDVLAELNDGAGYAMKAEWFAPHLEFRFPILGSIEPQGVVLELRQAIEPWHVLGETPGIGSTVRQVDSSLERVQVLVTGMTGSRHQVTCNGVKVPLHPTGQNGQFVAGVRFRAWQPAACLQPTIGRHAPLTFDLLDTWNGRSIGGCKYHVAHPGGRNYMTAPVNAYEAEARRVARFAKFGHTPGPAKVIDAAPSREFPFTLDLRQHLS